MSKLEDIVPPLELCKQIPAGAFEDSALVYRFDHQSAGKMLPETNEDDRFFYVEEREMVEFSQRDMVNRPPMFPAPTLAEILAKLPAAINGVGVLELALDDRAENNDGRYVICYNRYGVDSALEETTQLESDNNPATAALRLWLWLKGIEK